MNFLKKLFGRKKKEIAPNEEEIQKENECWYNDMYEKGEAHRGTSYGAGGSANSAENGIAQYIARR